MTRVGDLLAEGPTVSLEFSPPKDDAGEQQLLDVVDELSVIEPSFCSVTYGALGSTRERTRDVVVELNRRHSFPTMAHLTCVGHRKDDVVELLDAYAANGVENILALGGDPPEGGDHPTDYRFATELIETVKGVGDLCVGVAAFPEGHPRSPDLDTDRRFLAEKLRAADFAITQFGFDADDHFRMVDDLARRGVHTPVIPGLMLFTNVAGLRRMASLNGAAIPRDLDERLDAVDGDPTAVRELAVEISTELGRRYLDGGAPGLHLYTMNFSRAAPEVWANLGLGTQPG